jgi:hypothetical protein
MNFQPEGEPMSERKDNRRLWTTALNAAFRLPPCFLAAAGLLSLLSPVSGQLIDSNQNPPGLRWTCIETPHFEIVFPREIEPDGQRAAALLETLYAPHTRTLEADRRRTSVFLTNQGAVANGYAALAPRKAEWYHMPILGRTPGSGEWFPLLAVHEGRHLVQFDAADRGFTRFGGLLAGEAGVFGLEFFSIPMWWWEGDAVCTETAMTACGRGRIPEFGMTIRTQLRSGIRFPYAKEYFGSYRDRTPNWYELGYPLTAHGRKKYGPDLWTRVIRRSSRLSFWPFAFSNAVRHETGIGVRKLYEETLDELEAVWGAADRAGRPDSSRVLSPKSESWTSYLFPRYLDDGTVVAQKHGFDDAWSWVRIDISGNETLLKRFLPLEPGGSAGSAAAGRIVWDEIMPDPRWGARAWSSIRVMEAATGRTRRLVRRGCWFNPALSPDGMRFAAVEFGTDRSCGLVIADAETGRLIRRVPSPDNAFLQSPSWSADGRRVAFTFLDADGKGIAVLDTASGAVRKVLPAGWRGISEPVLAGGVVLFGSPKSGTDNIHALDLETGIEYRVTSAENGAFSPRVSPDGRRILYSDYTAMGMTVRERDFNPAAWTTADSGDIDAAGYARVLAGQEGFRVTDPSAVTTGPYPVRDYRPAGRLLNVHSWAPETGTGSVGLKFYSMDRLNTAMLAFGPVLDTEENRLRFEAEGAYAGFYPVIDFSVKRGGREIAAPVAGGGSRTESWIESSAAAGLAVPLNLSRSDTETRLRIGAEISAVRVADRVRPDGTAGSGGSVFPASFRAVFSRIRDGAPRDIGPRQGQMLQAEADGTPWGSGTGGSRLFGRAALYGPGFRRHDAVRFEASWEGRGRGWYAFPSSLVFARGYGAVSHERTACGSVTYGFPVAYPDLILGSLLYVKAVEGRLFFDAAIGTDGNRMTRYRSAGAECLLETRLFDLMLPIRVGLRWAHRFEDGDNRWQPVMGVEL